MIGVFVLNDDNDIRNAASRLEIKSTPIEATKHCSSLSVDSVSDSVFEINNNNHKNVHLSLQNSSFSSEDFDDNSSCENVNPRDKASKSKQHKGKKNELKGILKYPFDWQSSHYQPVFKNNLNLTDPSSIDSDDQGYYGTSLESPDSLNFFSKIELSIDNHSSKKHVTWAEKEVVFVYRKGSSILGCRKKNQKKAKRKREKARENDCTTDCSDNASDIDTVREMIADQRFSICQVDDFDSVSDASSSGCDCSTSEASSGDEEVFKDQEEPMNYLDEKKIEGNSNKQKRKKQRKRNRKSKQNVRNRLETGYDSD